MKGLQDVVNQAKALVQRLRDKETAVDATLKDVNSLSEHLTAMRRFREEAVVSVAVGKQPSIQQKSSEVPVACDLNASSDHQKRPAPVIAHQPIVLALLSENRRLAALEAENAELVKCLEEYQSALDMIMHKYRTHVTKFASTNQILSATIADMGKRSQAERTATELRLLDRMNDMSAVMRQACELDDNYYVDVVCLVTRLYNENRTLRELLDSRVLGGSAKRAPGLALTILNLPSSNPSGPSAAAPSQSVISNSGGNGTNSDNDNNNDDSNNNNDNNSNNNSNNDSCNSAIVLDNSRLVLTCSAAEAESKPEVTEMTAANDCLYSPVPATTSNQGSVVTTTTVQQPVNGLPYRLTASTGSSSRYSVPTVSSSSSYISGNANIAEFKLPKRRPGSASGLNNLLNCRNSNQALAVQFASSSSSSTTTFLSSDLHNSTPVSYYPGNENPPITSPSLQNASSDSSLETTLLHSDEPYRSSSSETLVRHFMDSDTDATPMPSPAATPHSPDNLSLSSSLCGSSSHIDDDLADEQATCTSSSACLGDCELEPPS